MQFSIRADCHFEQCRTCSYNCISSRRGVRLSPIPPLYMGVRHLAFVLTHKESAPRTGGAKITPNPPPQPQALPNSRLHILGGFEYPIIKQERAVAPVRRRAPDQGTERQATGHRLPTIRATCTWTWRTFSRGAVIFAPAPRWWHYFGPHFVLL